MAKAKVTSKKELIKRIAQSTDTEHFTVKEIVQSFMGAIIEELAKGNSLEFRDFGVFKTKMTKNRTARNPRTGEKVQVESHGKVQFKPGLIMKKRVGELAK